VSAPVKDEPPVLNIVYGCNHVSSCCICLMHTISRQVPLRVWRNPTAMYSTTSARTELKCCAQVEGEPFVLCCTAHTQDKYRPDVDHIVTAASCTTNCLAPVVKVRGRYRPFTGDSSC
jgi:hypothetical protein